MASANVSTKTFAMLARQDELLSLGRPLLAGVSRKSFLGHALKASRGKSPAPALGRIQHCYTHLNLGAPGPSRLGTGECSDPRYTNSENPLEREAASIAAMAAAILHGASIMRVHEVRSAVEAAAIAGGCGGVAADRDGWIVTSHPFREERGLDGAPRFGSPRPEHSKSLPCFKGETRCTRVHGRPDRDVAAERVP